MHAGLTIGGLAHSAQLNPKTIRYYEGLGLLPRARRSESGYRLYSNQDIGRIQLIKRARLLGLSLAEIQDIVSYAVDGRCASLQQHLLPLITAKIGELDHRVEEMMALRTELERYRLELSERVKQTGEEGVCPSQEPCGCMT
jgi:MerR family copper efflux transcriptional regulator